MKTYREALSELGAAQKSARGVSLYSRFVNRPAGRVLAAGCYVLRLSPNQVTLLSAAVTICGLIVMISTPPTPLSGVLVSLLLLGGFALDSADGQVARLTGRGSPAGEWLDHVVDSGKVVAVHAAVLVMAYRFLDLPPAFLLAPLGFQVVGILTFFGGELHRSLSRRAEGRASNTRPSVIRSVALLPADYGVLVLSFMILGWPPAFVSLYGLLLLANAVIMGMLLTKWFRTLLIPATSRD